MKKQTLKINQSDKQLLIILIAIVIGFLCYTFIINPQLEEGEILKAQSKELQNELSKAKEIVAKLPELQKEEKEKKIALSEKYEAFFYDLNQERILNKLDALMIETGLAVSGYTPSIQVVSSVIVPKSDYSKMEYPLLDLAALSNPELEVDDNNTTPSNQKNDAENKDVIPPDAVPTVDIGIGMTGADFPTIMNFIKKTEGMEKTFLIKSIELNKVETGIDGNIVFSLYAMPKLNQEQKDDFKFLPVVVKGKENPFI